MGYTHYWRTHDAIPAVAWDDILRDARRLVDASPTPLSFETGDGREPVVGPDMIRFNGADEGCETFLVRSRQCDFDFCKTRREDYDTVVCAVLAVAEELSCGALRVSSDGQVSDWTRPIAWASRVLGRTVPMPGDVRDPERLDD